MTGGGTCPHSQLQDGVSDTRRLVQCDQHEGGQVHHLFDARCCLQPVRERAPKMSKASESNLKKRKIQLNMGGEEVGGGGGGGEGRS